MSDNFLDKVKKLSDPVPVKSLLFDIPCQPIVNYCQILMPATRKTYAIKTEITGLFIFLFTVSQWCCLTP